MDDANKQVAVISELFHAAGAQGIVDDALQKVEAAGHAIRTVLVFDHALAAKRADVAWVPGRDVWWQDAVSQHPTTCPIEWMGAEDPLFKVHPPALAPLTVQPCCASFNAAACRPCPSRAFSCQAAEDLT